MKYTDRPISTTVITMPHKVRRITSIPPNRSRDLSLGSGPQDMSGCRPQDVQRYHEGDTSQNHAHCSCVSEPPLRERGAVDVHRRRIVVRQDYKASQHPWLVEDLHRPYC